MRVFSEKRAEIEDQQLHLNNGLQRLSETQAALQEMSVSLGAKGEELARKEAEANDKLQAMVQDQQVSPMIFRGIFSCVVISRFFSAFFFRCPH